jgi:hypothetical protein
LTLLDNFNVSFNLLCYFSSLNGNLLIEKVFKVLLVHWQGLRSNELRDLEVKSRACLFIGSLSALLTDVSPCGLNRRHGSFVDSLDIHLDELDPFEATHHVPVDALWLDVS